VQRQAVRKRARTIALTFILITRSLVCYDLRAQLTNVLTQITLNQQQQLQGRNAHMSDAAPVTAPWQQAPRFPQMQLQQLMQQQQRQQQRVQSQAMELWNPGGGGGAGAGSADFTGDEILNLQPGLGFLSHRQYQQVQQQQQQQQQLGQMPDSLFSGYQNTPPPNAFLSAAHLGFTGDASAAVAVAAAAAAASQAAAAAVMRRFQRGPQ
jgi:hypothetical protein